MRQRYRTKRVGKPRLHGDEGGAVVEAALLMPFLCVTVFGTIDAGRAFSLKSKLTNMAREGAAFAQFNPTMVVTGTACNNGKNIRNRAWSEEPTFAATSTVAVKNLTTGTTISNVCPTNYSSGVVTAGDRIEVKVSKTMKVLTPFIGVSQGSNLTITGREEVVAQVSA